MENNVKIALELIKEKVKNMSVLYVEDEEFLRITTANALNKLFQIDQMFEIPGRSIDRFNNLCSNKETK